MALLLKEDIGEFDDMPADVNSYKQKVNVKADGTKGVKTIIRVCKLKDGSEKTVVKTILRDFHM